MPGTGVILRRLGAVTTVYDQVLLSEKIGGAVKREGKLFDEKTWGDLLEGPGKF